MLTRIDVLFFLQAFHFQNDPHHFFNFFPMHDILWIPIENFKNQFFFYCGTLIQVNAFGATCCQNKHPSTPFKCCLFRNTPLLGLCFTYFNMTHGIHHKLTKLHKFIQILCKILFSYVCTKIA